MILQRKMKKMNEESIEKAIQDFEEKVDFELVPVIANHSSYVEHISWIISLTLMIFFVGLIDSYLHNSWESRTLYYLGATILAVALGKLIDKSDTIDRFFISKAERHRQVMEKAQRVFFLKRLHQSKSTQALLLYVSVMERMIVILHDPNMNIEGLQKIEQNLLEIVQKDFAAGKYEQGFLDAIRYLKAELEPRFPQKSQQITNQHANKLIWWNV